MRANPPRRVVNLIWKQAFSIQLRRRSAVGALGAVLAAIALLAQIAGPTVCRMLLLARQRGLCSFPCCDHREGRIPERSHRLRGVGGERPDPPFRHLSCPCPAPRSLAPSSLDRRVAAPAARCPSISLVQNGALAQRRSKFGERGHRFLPHFPHSAVDMWRPGDLGSFSARPSLSARQCISAHTSSGVMPHSCHSTTKW